MVVFQDYIITFKDNIEFQWVMFYHLTQIAFHVQNIDLGEHENVCLHEELNYIFFGIM